MNIVLVDASSVDGLITCGDDTRVTHWSSEEDWQHFLRLRQQYNLLVMGRKTFEAAQPKPDNQHLRVVLTAQPDLYADAARLGELEFSGLQPRELVNSLEARGYTSMLLLGGGMVNGAFLSAGLGDELYLTIEPLLFGTGTPLLGDSDVNVSLQLLESTQLNTKGTLLLHYAILHSAA